MDLSRDDLTIRLTGDDVVVSTDDGTSFTCRSGPSARIRSLLDSVARNPATRSAATLASLAEARHCRPSGAPTTDRVPAPTPQAGPSVAIGSMAAIHDGIGPLLRQRRSARELQPCQLADLATLLFSGARVLDEWRDHQGVNVSHRPYPSAGGRHPISILVLASAVDGLAPGAWAFDPAHCVLSDVGWDSGQLDAVMIGASAALAGNRPPALVMAVGEPERTLSKYPAGTAHLWRDTGAVLAILHLLASSLGMASCIVGTSGLLAKEDAACIDLGALALGR